jgi:hypothetical protein
MVSSLYTEIHLADFHLNRFFALIMSNLQLTEFVKRPNVGSTGRATRVRANFFEVQSFPENNIHHYDITITPDVPPVINRKIWKTFEEQDGQGSLNGIKPVFSSRALPLEDDAGMFEVSNFAYLSYTRTALLSTLLPICFAVISFSYALSMNQCSYHTRTSNTCIRVTFSSCIAISGFYFRYFDLFVLLYNICTNDLFLVKITSNSEILTNRRI